jgi:signal peptidase II
MKFFLKHLLVFLIIIGITFFLRHLILSQEDLHFVGWKLGIFQVKIFTNSGFIFGLFKSASHFIRIVLISMSLGIVTVAFAYFYTFLGRNLQFLRLGMTLLLAGIIGNGLEKIFCNFVVDYLSIDVLFIKNYIFNFSDFIQLCGLVIIIKEIFKHQDMIWFPNLRRQKILIYKEIQISFTLKILGIVFIGNLTQLILTTTLLFPHLNSGSEDFKDLYIICFIILNLIMLPILGYYLVKELLRCIGPVYALERHLSTPSNDGEHIKLRQSDYFSSLENAFNKFIDRKFKS